MNPTIIPPDGENYIIVTIPGKPIPNVRHRYAKGVFYDPQAQIKEEVYWTIEAQLPRDGLFSGGWKLHKDPCSVEIQFFFKPPKSLSKKKQAELINQPHTKKPDIDNLVKFYLDAAKISLYYDDAQIHQITASKKYAETEETVIKIIRENKNV